MLRQNEELVKLLAGIGNLEIETANTSGAVKPAGSIGLAGAGFEAFVFIADAVDIAALKRKFAKDLDRDRAYIQSLRAKLANEQFVKNAPAELVAAEKIKLETGLAHIAKVETWLQDL